MLLTLSTTVSMAAACRSNSSRTVHTWTAYFLPRVPCPLQAEAEVEEAEDAARRADVEVVAARQYAPRRHTVAPDRDPREQQKGADWPGRGAHV